MDNKLNSRIFVHNLFCNEKKYVKENYPSYIDQAKTVLWLIKDQPKELKNEACLYFSELKFSSSATMLDMVWAYHNEFLENNYSDILTFEQNEKA